jgi:ATP-dependent DNA helicase RecG
VIIGTQALLSDGVEFADAGLVVTDEQHRFGVNQRATLAGKSGKAHLLVMSATPIPRSMALISYGDLDVSRIISMPPGRQRVDTFAVDESYRPRLEAFIEKQVASGGQVYIVCPAVEETEELEAGEIPIDDITMDGLIPAEKKPELPPLKAAVEYSAELKARFPHLTVDFLHGRMKGEEKERVMSEFAEGKTNILVSTTVIEVGVNVPNACLMIVENADRFGLSQLHQLRGRVGRGKRKSFCVLVSDAAKAEDSVASMRLKSLCTLYDGYAIAEQDLLMRGPGDFFRAAEDDSIRQSGGIKLPLAEQCDDATLMSAAFAEANALLSRDKNLASHQALKKRIVSMFEIQDRTMN